MISGFRLSAVTEENSAQLKGSILRSLLSILPVQPGANPEELRTSQNKPVDVKIDRNNPFL